MNKQVARGGTRRGTANSGSLPKVMFAVRKMTGLSQAELAELAGISRQTLSYYETGSTEPATHNLDSWILAVKCQLDIALRLVV